MLKRAVLAFLCLYSVRFAPGEASDSLVARSLNDYEPDIEPYEDHRKPSRTLFNYRRNGVKIDVKVVPAVNVTSDNADDDFPDFPVKDVGRCLLDFSLSCARDRIARYIDTIASLDKISLFGNGINLVKARSVKRTNGERRMIDASDGGVGKIDRSIDDFFDSFALRISLPRMKGRKESNEIDIMLDENNAVEGRGKKGGGGKGGGKGCKKMMMTILMMGKMKLMAMGGMMGLKGMMMAGMSLMISKAMLIMKLMSLKMKGGGGFGGGGGGGGGGQLKEIVLLTKASSNGGGGNGGGVSDSYGAPPSSSYGAPSSGGGGYDYSGGGGGGGGGGWGRSFNNRIPMSRFDFKPETKYNVGSSNFSKNFDLTAPSQPANELPIGNSSALWNDTANWDSSNLWKNLTGSSEINKKNMTLAYYDSANDEFHALRAKSEVSEENVDPSVSPKNSRAVYANKWNNYEAADQILTSGTPMVATRRKIRGRVPKAIPVGVA